MIQLFVVTLILFQINVFVRGQNNNDGGFFPFAIDVKSGDEVLLNAVTSVDQLDVANGFVNNGFGSFKDNKFDEQTYPVTDYVIFQGLDDTSMFGTSIAMSDKYAVVGANGYGKYFYFLLISFSNKELLFKIPLMALFTSMAHQVVVGYFKPSFKVPILSIPTSA